MKYSYFAGFGMVSWIAQACDRTACKVSLPLAVWVQLCGANFGGGDTDWKAAQLLANPSFYSTMNLSRSQGGAAIGSHCIGL